MKSAPFLELKDRVTHIPGKRSPFLELSQARREQIQLAAASLGLSQAPFLSLRTSARKE